MRGTRGRQQVARAVDIGLHHGARPGRRALCSGHRLRRLGYVKDGNRISLFCACTGELVWGWGVIGFYWVYPGRSACSDSESDGEELARIRSRAWRARPAAARIPRRQAGSGEGTAGTTWRGLGTHRAFEAAAAALQVRPAAARGVRPGSCCCTCDKACNGMELDRCLARLAVAHFGQAPAGSPLNCIALCLLRHTALRSPASGERRGDAVTTGNAVVWSSITGRGLHLSQAGQGPVGLLRARGWVPRLPRAPSAEAVDASWVELCGRLGVPLNLDKRQRCPQQVEYVGVLFDTLRGLLLILPERLKKLLACRKEWAELQCVTARFIESVWGRMLHSFATRVCDTPDESHYDTLVIRLTRATTIL